MSDLTFNSTTGYLTWGAVHYSSVTGPHGKGALPKGNYTIKVRHAVVGDTLKSSYENSVTGNRWFIPITPQFSTSRDGFGIHPDGNVPGTLGCIGVKSSDAGSFWTRWNTTILSARPTRVTVTG
jgi:hypothetical protein